MMLIYYKTWIYQCLIKQVKSPSICYRAPNLVRILQTGRSKDRGVTCIPLLQNIFNRKCTGISKCDSVYVYRF